MPKQYFVLLLYNHSIAKDPHNAILYTEGENDKDIAILRKFPLMYKLIIYNRFTKLLHNIK